MYINSYFWFSQTLLICKMLDDNQLEDVTIIIMIILVNRCFIYQGKLFMEVVFLLNFIGCNHLCWIGSMKNDSLS